jgi:S1-C subfamily serine protease
MHERPTRTGNSVPGILIPLFLFLVICAGLLGGCFGSPSTGTAPASAPSQNGQSANRPSVGVPAFADVYERSSSGVVNISVMAQVRDPFGRSALQEGSGSGFVIDKEGHIVTNEHVVAGADRLDITLADGSSYIGVVVAEDPPTDLALVRLQAPADKLNQLNVVKLGDSDSAKVGEWVVAVGNPFGLERSATVGVVSSLGRTRPGLDRRLITDMIQTDAAINPGNSGGPLFNLAGEVIGINEQIEAPNRGNVGIGFAIPVNTLKRYLPDLKAGRQPQHASMGIAGASLTPILAEQLGLQVTQGVIVGMTVPGSPAAEAGFRAAGRGNPAAADVITEIASRPVRTFEELADVINDHNPGDTVEVKFMREGQMQNTRVRLSVYEGTEAR